MHAHSDLALLRDPDHSAKAAQGVTLEVLGQDGLSYAPVDDRTLAEVRRAITGWNGDGSTTSTSTGARSASTWTASTGFDGAGIAVNAAYLIPQGTVRMLAVGWEDRQATAAELDRMRQLVAEGLEQGAVGMSSGLTYTPGMYAERRRTHRAVPGGGAATAATTARTTAPTARAPCEAYEEMVALTREAGCALHLAHATMNFGVNKGRAPELLALLDEALAAGADISLDTYPYTPGCTTLVAMLPSWASEGGPEAVLARLRGRRDGRADPPRPGGRSARTAATACPSSGTRSRSRAWPTRPWPSYVGRTIAASRRTRAARRPGSPPAGCCSTTGSARRSSSTSATRRTSGRSCATASTPAARDGILQGAKPHPRAYGTFPHYLGRYVRELGVLSLEECVAHLTSRPAARLRLPDRGLVREGYRADLVLFDPATVAAGSTLRRAPRTLPDGHPARPDRRPVRHRGRAADGRPGGPGGPPDPGPPGSVSGPRRTTTTAVAHATAARTNP